MCEAANSSSTAEACFVTQRLKGSVSHSISSIPERLLAIVQLLWQFEMSQFFGLVHDSRIPLWTYFVIG